MVFLLAVCVLLALLLGTLLAPVHLRVRTVLDGTAMATAEVRWLGLGRRLDLNLSAKADAALRGLVTRATEPEPGTDALDASRVRLWQRWARWRLGGARAALAFLAPRLRVGRLRLLAEVGSGDAMVTAIACGGLWTLFTQALGAARGYVQLPEAAVQVVVQPQFGPPGLRALADLRLRVRTLDLVRATWRALRPALHGRRLLRGMQRGH